MSVLHHAPRALFLSGLLFTSQALAGIPDRPDWTLGFSDDFDGSAGSSPDSSKWQFDLGTQYPNGPSQWGTGEIQQYTSSTDNCALDGNGNLLITPINANGGWTSARIESVDDSSQAQPGGKLLIEASISSPAVDSSNGLGYWPAFWTLGQTFRDAGDADWPASGEFDIMEDVNGGAAAAQTMHCGVAPGGPCNEFDGIGATAPCSGSSCPANFHTYTVEVDRSVSPETVTFSVDGVANNIITQSDLGDDTWDSAVHRGSFILLNVAMGGSYPNGVAGQTTPTSDTISGVPMIVDYVAVWTQ